MAFMASADKCTGNNLLYLASKEELLYRAFHYDMLELMVSLSTSMLKLVDEKSG